MQCAESADRAADGVHHEQAAMRSLGTARFPYEVCGVGPTLLPLTLTRFFCSFLSTRAMCILRRSSGVSTRASACALQREHTLSILLKSAYHPFVWSPTVHVTIDLLMLLPSAQVAIPVPTCQLLRDLPSASVFCASYLCRCS